MNIRIVFVFGAAFLMLLAGTDVAHACSCVKSATVDREFAESGNVAVLKLQAVEKRAEGEEGYGYGGVKQSRLTVEKVFKGNLKVGEELNFGQGGGGDCIWTFDEKDIGTEYLFYLGEKPVKTNVWAGFYCSRSGSAKRRAADLLYLENVEKVRGKTRFSGQVMQEIESAVEDNFHNNLAGRKIRIAGNGKNIELKTDRSGVYEIYDLPAGKYQITPEKIGGYKFYDDGRASIEIEIKAKSHTELDFRFVIDNRIRGKIFGANGKPLKDVCLKLVPARGEPSLYFYEADCTDKDGKFELDEIPAGTYVIVVNDDGEISADEPFGTFYYPNVGRRADAAEISIGAGDFIDYLIINAPQTAETITISGVLLFENGKPVAEESIRFFAESDKKKTDDEYPDADARETTDAKGQFSIRILKGQKGRLFGSMFSYIGEYENCPKLDKTIRAKGDTSGEIETPAVRIEANTDLSGVELKFPFPSCKKAKNE